MSIVSRICQGFFSFFYCNKAFQIEQILYYHLFSKSVNRILSVRTNKNCDFTYISILKTRPFGFVPCLGLP